MVTRSPEQIPGHSPKANVRWLGPLPIWARPGPAGLRLEDGIRAGQPAILRFDHDDFMQDYLDVVQSEPERLGEWIARPETWREPMASPRPSRPDAGEPSRAAFLFDRTRRLTAAKKPLLPGSFDLQALKTRLRSKPNPPASAISDEQLPLKLFQPAQKRHYLVTASLIREEPGLPDCHPEPTRQEKASFVVRRLHPPEGHAAAPLEQWDEYGFVPGPKQNSWQPVGTHTSAAVRRLVAGEEQLPMFPVSYQNTGCSDRRKLFNGSIPVGRREQWVGAALGAGASGDTPFGIDAAEPARSVAAMVFQADVVAPWKLLLEQAEFKKNAAGAAFPNFDTDSAARARERRRMLRTSRDALQTGSWYVLLDLALFLQKQLPTVWQALEGEIEMEKLNQGEQDLVAAIEGTILPGELAWEIIAGKPVPARPGDLNPSESALLEFFKALAAWQRQSPGTVSESWLKALYDRGWSADIPAAGAPYPFTALKWTLSDALVAAAAARQGLEEVQTTLIRFDDQENVLQVDSNWPDFLFPLADAGRDSPMPAVDPSELEGLSGLERRLKAVDVLAGMVEALLPPGEPVEELMDSVPQGDGREAWFVVRCVYERPRCGPLFPALVSAPTQKFQMAPFFDPDAPARPVRIPMPLDISPAGLRKYQKNTGLVISDMLCGKIRGIRKMTLADLVLSVLPWPFHKDLPDPGSGTCQEKGNSFGMICSLSIPIVTLCALILMMIMVALFDLIFRWIPYLFICLPIPGLKGKKGGG